MERFHNKCIVNSARECISKLPAELILGKKTTLFLLKEVQKEVDYQVTDVKPFSKGYSISVKYKWNDVLNHGPQGISVGQEVDKSSKPFNRKV
jgi:hypothetical protein